MSTNIIQDIEAQISRRVSRTFKRWLHNTRSFVTLQPLNLHRLAPGYPQFSALIGAHPAFSIARQFCTVRARLLLMKQNRVSDLESKLERIDTQEQRPLFLGTFQADGNTERRQTLEALDRALAEYDALLERNARVLQLPTASERNISSLRNWVTGTGNIYRSETKFLYEPDLCAVGYRENYGMVWLESLVEIIIIRLLRCFQKESRRGRIFVFSRSMLRALTSSLITAFVLVLLLIPIVVIPSVESTGYQMFCILIASMLFIITLSGPMNAKPAEIFGAGATYAALLVVFLIVPKNSR
ncbi:uncharacterized protein F4822DRAFT_431717 [Hypoxylon trugodes]|uniref:uncharacterized protein n=1 Tax=Hypoxylon trugodes TaxID=326681 RepID=UPI002197154C|nr:uncharacterized protein F4822DRAFT_431717 [Hypoxylon trugodes]KAI1386849.1 hypothetical protein F4822DRAFT_431717 [Hypoxylon trugodes]